MQRHHYVPRFYLRQWYIKNKSEFWLCFRDDKGHLQFRNKSAKSVAYKNGLYSTVPNLLNPNDLISNEIEDKFFSPLDSAASIVHRKLIDSGPKNISSNERYIWSVFVNSLLERTPTRIELVRTEATKIADGKIEELNSLSQSLGQKPPRFLNKINVSELVNNTVLNGMRSWICQEETINYFYGMRWVVVRLPEGNDHFLTGDTPVVVNGSSGGYPIHVLSLALSPNALLVMHAINNDFDEGFLERLSLIHSPLIAEQTKRYLVSSKKLFDNGKLNYAKIANEIYKGVASGREHY